MHLHVGSAAIPLAALADCPVLHTLHTGITVDDVWILERFPDVAVTALSSVSSSRARGAARAHARDPYGFDFDRCTVADGAPGHLAFLGRMAPHKGPDAAIRIARAARRPIHLAGAPVTPEDRGWFAREIEPQIDGRDVVWLGEVDDARKDELFRSAAALLFPIAWEEPFGL